MYLLTKHSFTYGEKIYYIIGENHDKYLVCESDTGYYATPEDWMYIKFEDVKLVNSSKMLLESKIGE